METKHRYVFAKLRNSNSNTAEELGVDQSTVQYWQKKFSEMNDKELLATVLEAVTQKIRD